MIRILSTKKLLPNQKQFLLNAGFAVIEADFIRIKNVNPELKNINENLIFTSQNAIKSILENEISEVLKTRKCFCVGKKTKSMLEQNGFEVVISTAYASDLAEQILKDYQTEAYTFFSGNLRQDDLPELLKGNVLLNEIEVYQTILEPTKINAVINGILFFSPSAVESFLKENNITSQTCFCIGQTTAKALKGITENIIIANQPSIENVIIQTINHYKKA